MHFDKLIDVALCIFFRVLVISVKHNFIFFVKLTFLDCGFLENKTCKFYLTKIKVSASKLEVRSSWAFLAILLTSAVIYSKRKVHENTAKQFFWNKKCFEVACTHYGKIYKDLTKICKDSSRHLSTQS